MSTPILRYGLKFDQDQYDDLKVEMFMIRKGGRWIKNGQSFGEGLPFHYEMMRRLLWPELDDHRWHRLCRDELLRPKKSSSKVTVFMGPGSCVAGHTRLLNPITGEDTPISDLCESGVRPIVMTLAGPWFAGVPFVKGTSKLFEIILKSGKRFTATAGHRVLTEHGFQAVASLRIGQCLLSYDECLPGSSEEPYRSVRSLDALRYSQTVRGFQSGYPASSCFDDERLHWAAGIFQSPAPSRRDAPRCRLPRRESLMDAWACESKRIHFYQSIDRLSNSDALIRDFLSGMNATRRFFSEKSAHAACLSVFSRLCESGRILALPFAAADFDSAGNFQESEKPCSKYRVQADAVQQIKAAGTDMFYDIQVPDVHHYFAEGTIHHNSGKTHEASWPYLCEYFVFPNETCVLVSSTDMRGLRLRVWGEITMLWEKAINRYDYLPGHLLDSRVAITTDQLEDGEFSDRTVRDMRKGIVGIPTIQSGKFIGLGKWQGIKQKRVRLIADEAAIMGETFLSAFANLNKNEDFEACVIGNPNDPLDPLGKAAEPKEGWTDEFLEPTKTRVWDTRFMNGRCVNLIGPDSPNFDFPEDKPTRYKYLISREKIADTLSFFAKDSVEYYSQCVGSMKIGTMARRVITRALCEKFGALGDVIWKGESAPTRIAGLDASYGGDRCALTELEFGEDKDGKIVISFKPPVIVPVIVKSEMIPEDQIAGFCRAYCEKNGIAPENFYHDSTGRGTLGTALARIWSAQANPVEFGGAPTIRPVSLDLMITDPKTGKRRLKRADEHYSKFVTELWFAVRYAIEAGQVRNLPEDVMEEGCMREWNRVRGDKIEIESKVEMKVRIGRSPDLFDSAVIAVEGARRRGFQISKLGSDLPKTADNDWLENHTREYRDSIRNRQLAVTI